jgi:hypothetical protein
MLYDTVASAESGMYCIVVSYRLTGALDADALFDAWRAVVARHPILRTSFHWHERQEPTQAVHREVALPVAQQDWRGVSIADQQARLTALLEEEHCRGFDVTRPPLIRLTLVRCADEVHELVVAHHHLLLDGSCKPLLFAEVFAIYEARRERRSIALDPPAPYRRFIEWLRAQDGAAAERFWRDELAGLTEPTRLWPPSPSRSASGSAEPRYEEYAFGLDVADTDRLRLFARSQRLTVNTIVSGAWALLLAQATRRDDVVFGATVNARPPDLDGSEAMLGLFINTLPVRFAITPDATIVDWLRRAQLRQMRARELDYAALSSIQRWSAMPRGVPLFDSIIVFENNVGYGADSERHGSLEISDVRAHIRNSLPLTLRCVPGRTLSMQLLHESSRIDSTTIRSIAERLARVLAEMPADPTATVARLLQLVDEIERQQEAVTAGAFQKTVRDKLLQRKRQRRPSETKSETMPERTT